jgi:oligosaccharyl transferase (archaeosortase A-associated)
VNEQTPEKKRRLPPVVIVGIILAVICGISVYLRIVLPHDKIFVGDWVWFRGTDAWYHMRLIENIVHNFPHVNSFDPYILYPGGGGGPGRPFFDLLVAGIILLVSLGAPAQHTIDAVGAYMPAILGTLALFPVYFIGKELFNRWVGVISAALVAILPGEFLNRTLLGFTDHHAGEALFSTVTVLFLIMAIKRAREREVSFSHFLGRDWPTITMPLVYTLLAGIFLGIYLLSWQGGLLLVFIIFVYLVIQFIVDHLRGKSSDYLCLIGTPVFLIALLMLLPVLHGGRLDTIYRVSMLVAIVAPIVLSIISRLFTGKAVKPAYYPLALLALVGIGLAALHAIEPSLLRSMLGLFSVFTPSGAALSVLEVQRLTLNIAWVNFTTSFFISFISLCMLIYIAVKERSADKTLFLIWSITMLIAVLGQRRFSYYFAINAGLLTGYFSWRMLDFAGLSRLAAKPQEVVVVTKKFKKRKKAREKARPKTFLQPRAAWVKIIVVGIAIFFLVFFPNISKAEALAKGGSLMDRGWYLSLQWLKDNSPEPFGDPNFYYALYPPKDSFQYPESAYGVMSWWDYGYWIMRIAHRIPNSNPTQARAREAADFFISQNESSADELADELGSKYVVIDYQMPTSKFYAMPRWAGSNESEYFGIYYQQTEDGKLQPVTLFYPTYYRSLVARLFNFDGKAVVPTESIVISYEERTSAEGVKYTEITNSWSFPSYEEAEAYIASQESGNYRVVGPNPFVSPVPLEELDHYEFVYQSEATTTLAGQKLPRVKIFRYLGPDEP